MRRILWAGDSTVKFNKIDSYPQAGLSQGLLSYTKEDVVILSFAENGRSTKSFIEEGRAHLIRDEIKEGDFLFIEFGHNDEKIEDSARYTAPYEEYTDNLKLFIDLALSNKAYPLLITPAARRMFENGVFMPGSHMEYPDAMRKLGAKMGVPVADLTAVTEEYLAVIGDCASRSFFVYPKDNTHFSYHGAVIIAGLLADEIRKNGEPYSDLLI